MIYEYFCNSCKDIFETEQKITEPVLNKCKLCNAENSVKRLISNTSFVLQGSGWCRDGYSKGEK